MTHLALVIRHRTRPGKRNEVRSIWENYLMQAIAGNPGHLSYVYSFDNNDPDGICIFMQYANEEAMQDFLKTASYTVYLAAIQPLLLGSPEVAVLTPLWSKKD